MKNNWFKKNIGFSLVELAITLTIVAVVLGISVTAFDSQLQSTRFKADKTKLEENKAAILEYFEKAGKLPCPGIPTYYPGVPGFGEAAAASCDVGDTCSVIDCSASTEWGDIPFVELGIPAENIYDSYGNKFVYGVQKRFTRGGNASCEAAGGIWVYDFNNNLITDRAMFALIAGGENQRSVYAKESGTKVKACDTSLKEGENCTYDKTIRVSEPKLNPATATDYYDDLVTWAENPNRKTCPAGISGCYAWYDSGDSCSYYTGSSNYVGVWYNKTDKGPASIQAHLHPSITYAPRWYPATYNGKPGIFFDGINDLMYTTNSNTFAMPTTDFTIFVVTAPNGTSGSIAAITNDASYTAGNYSYAFKNPGLNQISMMFWTDAERYAPVVVGSNNTIASMRIGPTAPIEYRVNGNVFFQSTTFTNGGTYPQNNLVVGGHSSHGGYYHGYLLEMIFFDRRLTNSEMEIIEEYLNDKWDT